MQLEVVRKKEMVKIGCSLPANDWPKFNIDGASKNRSEMAGCGGLCSGSDASGSKSFVCSLGSCNACIVELWKAFYALKMASKIQLNHIIIELDSQNLVNSLTHEDIVYNQNFNLLKKVNDFLKMD